MKRTSSLDARPSANVGLGRAMCALTFACALSACVGLERARSSGYADRGDELNQGLDRRTLQRESAVGELGLATKTDGLSEREEDAVDARIALRKAESALEGKREREQYFRNKPYMHNDRERLEFLSLDSYEGRNRWLNAKGIQGSTTTHPSEIQALIDINDITLGMTKQAVRDSWGEPDLVEVAGNPVYGNERWHYSEQTSSTEGYHTQNRMVYFESGRVAGWESR